VSGSCEHRNKPLHSIPWLAEELLASQEGLCSTQLVFMGSRFCMCTIIVSSLDFMHQVQW
jgi:2-keto-4-pentenoate hydratase